MYACTLTGPWGTAIMHLGKDVENRPTRPLCVGVGGRLAIHAGKLIDDDARVALMHSRFGGKNLPKDMELPTGAILGTVEVAGWLSVNAAGEVSGEACPGEWSQMLKLVGSPWRQPQSRWHWWVRDPRPLSKPIPCRGAQCLWTVPEQHAAALEAL